MMHSALRAPRDRLDAPLVAESVRSANCEGALDLPSRLVPVASKYNELLRRRSQPGFQREKTSCASRKGKNIASSLLPDGTRLKLVKNRYRVAVYCLRAVWNAACVVGRRPGGGLGLVYAQTGREEIASWLTLTEIERLLANWNGAGAESVGRVTISAQRSPLRQLSQTFASRPPWRRAGRSPRYRLTLGPSDASPSARSM